ncbi:MAG: carboxypeptidase regulatory-like domain-containing protein [Acidobacteriota bacterium]
MKKLILVFFTLTLMVFLGTNINAQEQSGEVVGTVVLADGSAIPGVLIEVDGKNLVGKKTAVSNENGAFRILGLPPGNYDFVFTLEGFKTFKRNDVKVVLGKTVKLDILMETGTIKEEIVITGKAPVIDVRNSAAAVNISKDVFLKLPKGRDFTSLIVTQAGTNNENIGGGLQMEGASSSENTFFVDGVNTTTIEGGVSGQAVNYDYVEEVQTKATGYNAEFGGSMGGVVNVITKSGGNEYHGDLLAYLNADWLDGEPRDALRLNPIDSSVGEYFHYPKDKYTTLEPGLALGGFLIKDKVWFYGNFMPRFFKQIRQVDAIGYPEAAGAEYDRTIERMRGSAKLTAAITPKIRISLSGTLDNRVDKKSLPSQSGSFNPAASTYDDYGYEYPGFTAAASLDWSIGDNSFLNIQGGMFETDSYSSSVPENIPTRLRHAYSNYNIPGMPDHLKVPAGYYNIGWSDIYNSTMDLARKTSAKADFTTYLSAGGEHVIKAGFGWNQLFMDKEQGITTEYWYFYWGKPTYTMLDGTAVPVKYGYARALGPYGTVADAVSDRFSFYLQDSWTIKDNLTLNFGVRLEQEAIPHMDDTLGTAFTFGFGQKIAPRFGFAYDLKGDGKTKIFGSAGLYYDVMKLDMVAGSLGGLKWYDSWYEIANLDWTLYDGTEGWSFTGSEAPINGGQFLESKNHRIPSTDNLQPIDSLKPTSKMEISLGFAQELSENVALTVRGTYNSMLETIEDIGVQTSHGEEYYIANPGSDWINEQYRLSGEAGLMPVGRSCPGPNREYYALSVQLDKKFSDNWLGGASVTFSRLTGNHSGLASSDEWGRQNPGVERYWDLWFFMYDASMNEVIGLLPTDRPIDFKFYGAYTFDFGLTVGVNGYAKTGTPVSTEFMLNNQQGWYPYGRADAGRTPFIWQLDTYVEYTLKLGKANLQLSANITNLTNNNIAQRTYNRLYDSAVYMSDAEILAGFNVDTVMNNLGLTKDPRFMMDHTFLPPISIRLGAKLSF